MKIAVVGSKGLVGSSFLKYWNEIAAENNSPQDELIPLDLPEFDLCSRDIIHELTDELKPDLIVNAAGINDIDWSEKHPNSVYNFHCHGTANLRQAAQDLNIRLVQISCAEVFYQENPDSPDPKETEDPSSESVFGRSKRDAETGALQLDSSLVVRTSSLFGESGPNSSGNIVETVLTIFQRTRKIHLLSDLKTAPLWTFDFLRCLHFLVRTKQTGLWHLAGQGKASPLEIAQHLLRQTGLDRAKPAFELLPITLKEYGTAAPHSQNLALNTQKYRTLAGAPPLPDWRDSINRFLDRRSCSF